MEIKYKANDNPRSGNSTLDTSRLALRTNGELYIINSTDGVLIPLDPRALAALRARVGAVTIDDAINAVNLLNEEPPSAPKIKLKSKSKAK